MKFLAIQPNELSVKFIEAHDLQMAQTMVGLDAAEVDHGGLCQGLTITVHEYGLMKNPGEGKYFSLGNVLYEGTAVIYATDERGETIDFPANALPPPVMFYRSSRDVEDAIRRGEVQRPMTAVNGEVLWQWRG